MMVAGISATAERERVVDFTFPFYHDSVRSNQNLFASAVVICRVYFPSFTVQLLEFDCIRVKQKSL